MLNERGFGCFFVREESWVIPPQAAAFLQLFYLIYDSAQRINIYTFIWLLSFLLLLLLLTH